MSNSEISKKADLLDKKMFSLYLRSESLKSLLDSNYRQDKSFESYKESKFYKLRYFSYSDYLGEFTDDISYSEYLSGSIDNQISYTNYLSSQLYIQNII